MELRQLEYFVAVARLESFTAAAEALFISQSALSVAVRKLEHELGVDLFERGPHGVMLTTRGRVVRERVQQILGMAAMLPQDALGSDAAVPETVRLSLAPIAGAAAILDLLEHRSDLPAGLTLQMEEVPSEMALADLARSRRDLALVVKRGPIELRHESLGETPLMVAMAATHPLADLPRVTVADLRGVPLMLMGMRSRLSSLILELFAEAEVTPRVIHRTVQLTFMVRMVETGQAVSFLPASAGTAHPSLTLRPLDPPVLQEIVLVQRPGHHPSERAERLIDRIRTVIAQNTQPRGS